MMLWKIAVSQPDLTSTIRGDSRNLLSGFQNNCNYQEHIKGFVKRGAYSSSSYISEAGVWRHSPSEATYRVTLLLKNENDANHEI